MSYFLEYFLHILFAALFIRTVATTRMLTTCKNRNRVFWRRWFTHDLCSYEKPYTRITPFVIGVALGYLFAKSPDYKLPGKGKVIAVCLWVLWFLVIDLLLFGFRLNGWDMNPMATQVMGLGGRVAYGGLQRLGWSLIMAWLLFACNYGYGGYIRSLLALKFWRPLSNLTYGVYLVHLLTLQVRYC